MTPPMSKMTAFLASLIGDLWRLQRGFTNRESLEDANNKFLQLALLDNMIALIYI